MLLKGPRMRIRPALLFCSLTVGACTAPAPAPSPPVAPPPVAVPDAPARPAQTYDGMLDYPARIALPPATEALIEVATSRGEERVATSRFALDGVQVPVPFSIAVPATAGDDGLVLRAAFVVHGHKRWRSQPRPLSPDQPHVGALTLAPIAPSIAQFRCGEMLVGFSADEDGRADLQLPSASHALVAVASASGAKYARADDDSTWFWQKGDEAMVQIDGEPLPACTRVGAGN